EQLGARPRLEWTADRRVRRIAVADLGDVAEPRNLEPLAEWLDERRERLFPGLGGIAAHADPRFDERAREPRPHRAVVIDAIASERTSAVVCRVAWLPLAQRARTRRRPQLALEPVA